MPNRIVTLRKLNPKTGEEIPSTPEEQDEMVRNLRQAIRDGKLEFTPEVKAMLGLDGLTPEVVEAWLNEKNGD